MGTTAGLRAALSGCACLVVALAGPAAGLSSSPSSSPSIGPSSTAEALAARHAHPAGRYIVRFKPGRSGPATGAAQGALANRSDDRLTFRTALHGFAGRLTRDDVARLRADPAVDEVVPDGVVTLAQTQWWPSWGLDRIDQPDLPLDGSYASTDSDDRPEAGDGAGARVYVLDTGLAAGHTDFAGRVVPGRNFADHVPPGTNPWPYDARVDPQDTSDCSGHGTHVAGTAVGTRFGVAKRAEITPVRVLNCEGWAYWSQVLAGVDWVAAEQENNPDVPMVANLSLSGEGFELLDEAVAAAVADGVSFVAAAGNRFEDACDYSPGRVPAVITVGASDSGDRVAPYSNFGACVDFYAPGSNIVSAGLSGPSAAATMSGTSMASPHAAGVVAVLRGLLPDDSPEEVADRLLALTRPGALSGTRTGTGDPNLLLQAPRTSLTSARSTPPAPSGVATAVAGCLARVEVKGVDEPGVIDGLSVGYDRSPSTEADDVVDVHALSTTRRLRTGTWYVHLRVVDARGVTTPTYTAVLRADCTPPSLGKPQVIRRSNTTFVIRPRGSDSASGYAGSWVAVTTTTASPGAGVARQWVAAGSAATWRAPRGGIWYVHLQGADKAGNRSAWLTAGSYRVR